MNDSPPKPNRKRRRWMVTGALLCVMSVAGCWYWPRGDQRFVGKWSVADELDLDKPLFMMDFDSNGAGAWIAAGSPTCLFSWSASGNRLTMGPNSPQSWRPALGKMCQRIASLTNYYFLSEPQSYEIVEIHSERIVIISEDLLNARKQILTRLPSE